MQIQDVLFDGEPSPQPDEMRVRLSDLAQEIVSLLVESDAEHSHELLSSFVGDLLMSATKQSIKEDRRKKQAEGIAKAKAEGVSFGRRRNPLPDNFEEARMLWRNHKLKLKDAAKHCGMAETSFYDAVRRMEKPNKVNSRKPLPENFEESRMLWRSHKLKMKEAAERCGMAATTFYDAVRRVESAEARD